MKKNYVRKYTRKLDHKYWVVYVYICKIKKYYLNLYSFIK